jgi:hypothetical protein
VRTLPSSSVRCMHHPFEEALTSIRMDARTASGNWRHDELMAAKSGAAGTECGATAHEFDSAFTPLSGLARLRAAVLVPKRSA